VKSFALVAALSCLGTSLLLGSVAWAGDPSQHLAVVPGSTIEVVGIDLDGDADARRVAQLYLGRDLHFATLLDWLGRARLPRGIHDALMMSDGIGQSAFVVTLDPMNDIQRQTFEAMMRAAGLTDQRGGRAATRGLKAWFPAEPSTGERDTFERPPDFSVLELSATTFVLGHRSIVEQIQTGLTRRGKATAPAVVTALGTPAVGASVWFASLAPAAAVPEPIVTTGVLTVDHGLLLELKFSCRTEADANTFRDQTRAWLAPDGDHHELDWLGLAPGALSRTVVTRVADRVHVVLTLTDKETSTILASVLETLAPAGP